METATNHDIQGVWVVLQSPDDRFLVCQELGENGDKPKFDKRRGDDVISAAETSLCGESSAITVQRGIWEETGLLLSQYSSPQNIGEMNVQVNGEGEFWVKVYFALINEDIQVGDLCSQDGDTMVIGLRAQAEIMQLLEKKQLRGGVREAVNMAQAALDQGNSYQYQTINVINHR